MRHFVDPLWMSRIFGRVPKKSDRKDFSENNPQFLFHCLKKSQAKSGQVRPSQAKSRLFGFISIFPLEFYYFILRWNVSAVQPGVNFANVLQAAFTSKNPKSTKSQLNHQFLFALLGSEDIKAVCKILVKSTPVSI